LVFAYISLDQIREIAEHLFAQNFQSNYKAEYGVPFCIVILEPSILELEEEPAEAVEAQEQ
jgi:hypothetical protein